MISMLSSLVTNPDMANPDTQTTPAMPTLLGIPIECRLRIFELVITDTPSAIEIDRPGERPCEWSVRKPLLSVCKQIRREALEYYQITLSIISPFPCRSSTRDNYRNDLSLFIRSQITHIRIQSIRGCDGRFINKHQFPNLKRVTVQYSGVQDMAGWRAVLLEPNIPSGHPFGPNPRVGDQVDDVLSGAHDAALLGRLVPEVSDFMLYNVPPTSGERGFEIYVIANVTIYRSVQSSRARIPITLVITWNHDTNEVIERSKRGQSGAATIRLQSNS